MNPIRALALARRRIPQGPYPPMQFLPPEMKSYSPAQVLGFNVTGQQPYLKLDLDPQQTIVEGYKASVWVAACVNLLMQACGSVPWVVKTRDGKGDWTVKEDDELTMLVEYPNDRLTRKFIISWMAAHLALNGNGLLRIVKGGSAKKPKGKAVEAEDTRKVGALELWPVHPKGVKPVPHPTEWISEYEWSEGGKPVRVPADEVVHAMLPDPDNPLWGIGLLKSVWKSIKGDAAAQAYRSKLMENGGVPPGAIIDPNIIGDENLKAAKHELQMRWAEASQGGVPLILTNGAQFMSLGLGSAALEVLEGRAFTVTEIVTAFGFLPAMFLESASTYSNLQTGVKWYWQNGAIPLLDAIAEALNLALIPKEERQNRWLTYDLSGVEALREDRSAAVTMFSTLIRNSVPRAEAASIAGLQLESIPDDDVALMEPGLVLYEDAIKSEEDKAKEGTTASAGMPPLPGRQPPQLAASAQAAAEAAGEEPEEEAPPEEEPPTRKPRRRG